MNEFSGYIEIDLGLPEKVPFKFGSNAYGLFCVMHGIEFWQLAESGIFGKTNDKGELTEAPDWTKLRDLFFCAHQAAMRAKGKEEMMNVYQFGDILDETEGLIEKLQGAVVRAKMMGFTLSELAKGREEKKK